MALSSARTNIVTQRQRLVDDQPCLGRRDVTHLDRSEKVAAELPARIGPVQVVHGADPRVDRRARQGERWWVGRGDDLDAEASQRCAEVALVGHRQMGQHRAVTTQPAPHTDRCLWGPSPAHAIQRRVAATATKGADRMDIGYYGINCGPFDNPDSIRRVALTAEAAGYESLWTAEHVVLVDPQEGGSPFPPEAPFVDTIATLAFLAAATDRIRLGSGIILLPQRDPIVLAKELAGIDVLSDGRLLVGVGVGYVEGEYEALGIPYTERGARMADHIDVLRSMWSERPAHDGPFSTFSGIQQRPRPVQRPGPPIHVGASARPALRRAVAQADGWYGFFQDVDSTAAVLHTLDELADEVDRPAGLGSLEISVTPAGPVDRDLARRYEDLGVHRLILVRDFADMSTGGDEDAAVRYLEETAVELGLGQ